MDHPTFEDLPYEIFELICTYLQYFDLAMLEQTSKKNLSTIQKLNLWKKVAMKWIQKYDLPAVHNVLKYMKENAVKTGPKSRKIMIGLTLQTKKNMDDLSRLIIEKRTLLLSQWFLKMMMELCIDESFRSRVIEKILFVKKKQKTKSLLDSYEKALTEVVERCEREISLDMMMHVNKCMSYTVFLDDFEVS